MKITTYGDQTTHEPSDFLSCFSVGYTQGQARAMTILALCVTLMDRTEPLSLCEAS